MATLFQLTQDMAALEEQLYENGGELTPEIEKALPATVEALSAKVDGYNALMRKFGSDVDAIDAEIKRLQALKKTATNAQKGLRQHLLYAMQQAHIDRLDGTLCKVSRRISTSLEVDENEIISPYALKIAEFRLSLPDYITIEAKISKTAIKQQFAGTNILPSGCSYQSTESLCIR